VSAAARSGARRVAFVVGVASGGTARHVSALAAGCRAAGLDVAVLGPEATLELFAARGVSTTPGSTAPGGTAPEGGTPLALLPVRIASRPRPASDLVTIARLRSVFHHWRPDVVHAHGVRAGAFAAAAIASLAIPGLPRRARPALAVSVHNAPPSAQPARLIYGLLERICARRADVVLCASADLLARMRGLGAERAEQFDVPAAPLPPPSAAALAQATADVSAAGRPVVLAVARLAPQKGLDVLIEAAARWRDRDPRPLTVIAGDGPLADELGAQASRAGADVRLLGARQDVSALLAIADVVVVPSRWEARALILQEAMRSGRPIVATEVGGTADLTGADGAVLVPPGDPAALAVAVTTVLDDSSLAARLRSAASTRSATLPSEQDAVRAALAIYARLTAGQAAAQAIPCGG
jgi:glycosyltransferase involved in cell wall biosynthesis